MLKDKKVIVVMPAYNAEQTLVKTYEDVMDQGIVDLVIVVDDASRDNTTAVAKTLEHAIVHTHEENKGYGGNQKSCYRLAVENGGDIVIMVHPDYQYTPKLIPAIAGLMANGLYDCVIASRILGGRALKDGMPIWRYIANRFLTLFGNVFMGAILSEYHTGYRAFSGKLLQELPLKFNSDDFVFDNEMLAQVIWLDYTIGEVSCPARYAAENSSINFQRSVKYGFGCLWTAVKFRLAKWCLMHPRMFPSKKRRNA
jgi:glycosyltransferase involved in cell wall biosynthesis